MEDIAVAFWGSKTFPRVLEYLIDRPEEELTLGQLQTALGANRESLHRALGRALVTGVITRRRVGNQYVYRADDSGPFYADVKSLCSKVLGPAAILRAALSAAGPPQVERAFIYGSVARGTDRPRSDVDVLVVGDATDFDLAAILRDAVERIPRAVNAVVYTRREIEDGLASGNPFLLEVWVQPKTMLIGREEELPHAVMEPRP